MPEAVVATAAPSPAGDVVEDTAAQTREVESHGIYWLLVTSGLALMIPAWLLPWFVPPTSNGVGFSPQDAFTQLLSGSPSGVGSLLVLLVGLALLAILAGYVYDAGCVLLAGRARLRNLPQRAGGAVLSTALFLVCALTLGLSLPTLVLFIVAVGLIGSLVHDGGVALLRGRRPFPLMRWRGAAAVVGLASTFAIWVLIGVYQEEQLFGPVTPFTLTDNAVWMMLVGFAVSAFAYLEGERIVIVAGSVVAATLAVVGLFVPWFRTDAILPSNRQYHSLLDALQSFEAGTILLCIVLVGVVVAVLGALLDAARLLRPGLLAIRHEAIRGYILIAAAAAAVAATCVVTGAHDALFGAGYTTIDNRAGFVLAGLIVAAIVPLVGERILASRTTSLALVAFVIGGLFPLIFNQSVGFVSWGAGSAATYILLSLGLNVVVGFAGLLDLGYAAFFAIGAYTAGSLASPRHGLYLPFWVILFIGAAVAALFGAILGAPTLRLRGDYLAIVTLGFGEIVPDMAKNNLFEQTGGPNGITGIRAPSIGNYSFGLDSKPYFWALLVIIVGVMLALRNLERSRIGRAWVAIREDEIAASATGINTVSTKLLAFAIGASVSGLAGAFYGAQLGVVTPGDFEFAVSVTALSTVVLGGIGNNSGAAVGALLISFIIFWILPHMQEWMGTIGTTTGITSFSTIDYSQFKFIIYGIILMSVMLLRPGGLLPSRARKIELQTGAESEPLAAVTGVA